VAGYLHIIACLIDSAQNVVFPYFLKQVCFDGGMLQTKTQKLDNANIFIMKLAMMINIINPT
jgi:hypothetical protein